MHKILTLNQIAPAGLERFARDRYETGSEFAQPDAILLRSHTLQPGDVAPSVRAIARAGAGVNNIPVDACSEAGVVVFNTPGANANSVKELVIAALLMSVRNLRDATAWMSTRSDVSDPAELNRLVEAEKKRFRGSELAGKALGVVGLGAIGRLVAHAGLELGMEVFGHDPALSVDAAWRLSHRIRKMDDLPSLFARSDFVTLHVPLLDATRGLINASSLQSFRAGSTLLNFARDGIVDDAAVIDALDAGRLRRYVTDFPHPRLVGRDDVLMTPHLGASTDEAEVNCAIMAVEQLVDFLENGNVRNSVNFPNVSLERTDGCRLAIANRNVPGMLNRIMGVLAEQQINVIDMLNKSRGEIAYNLIDIACEPADQAMTAIAAIEGVTRIRRLPAD